MTQKGKVLVVDDDQALLKMVKLFLEKSGFKVAVATNTVGAGYLLKDFDPDLVVLDVMLSGSLSGDQACETLRAFRPGVKIVLHSGMDESELNEMGRKHAADACVGKGGRPSVLVDTVKRLLRDSP